MHLCALFYYKKSTLSTILEHSFLFIYFMLLFTPNSVTDNDYSPLLFVSSCFHIFGFAVPAVCFLRATRVTSAINSSIMIPPVVSISTSVNLPARPGTNSW